MKRVLIVGLLVVVAAAGSWWYLTRIDPISAYVNKQFLPVSADEQRAEAIKTAASALGSLPEPNLAVSVSLGDAERALGGLEALKELGVSSLSLDAADQLLLVQISFERRFDGSETGLDQQTADLIRRLVPTVSGAIAAYMGVTGAVQNDPKGNALQLKLLPALRSVRLEKVTLAETFDASAAGRAIASALNKYADNVTGVLSRASFVNVAVPAVIDGSANPSQVITVTGGAAQGQIAVNAQPVRMDSRLLGVAPLISDGRVSAMAMIGFGDVTVTQGQVDAVPTSSAFADKFEKVLGERFQVPTEATTWVAVRRELLARAVNGTMTQAAACFTANLEFAEQRAQREIAFPDSSSLDCTPTRDCSPTGACDFPVSEDTRDCNKCLLWGFGGHCIQRGNDPFCEAAKAAENGRRRLDAAGQKLDCERLKTTKKLTCEVEKEGEKKLCEAGKVALDAVARTGKFANIDATVKARTSDLNVCIKSFNLSDAADSVTMAVSINGSATADVNFKFIPLDIVGHLSCQVPWTESRAFTASFREEAVSISSQVKVAQDAGGNKLVFEIPEHELKLKLQPSPTEYLLTSQNMTLACQGLNLVKPLVVVASAFVPELRGDVDYRLPRQTTEVRLQLPVQQIGPNRVKPRLLASPKAFVLAGDVSQ